MDAGQQKEIYGDYQKGVAQMKNKLERAE